MAPRRSWWDNPALRHAVIQGAGGFDYYWSGSAAGGGDGSVASPWTAAEVTAKPANFFAGKRLGMLPSTNDAANGNTAITRADASIYLGASNSLGNETDNSLADHITDCSAPLTGTWSNVATNIWQITVTQISDGSASGNILHNGVPGQIVQNRAALTSGATAGLYFVAAWGWQGVAGITSTTSLVIETYSTVDPSGDGITRRYSKYKGIELTGANATVKNLTVKMSIHQGGNIRCTATGALLEGVRAENGSRHAAFVAGSWTIRRSTFSGGRNRQESGSGDHVVCNQAAFAGTETGVFDTCTFEGGSYLSVTGDNIGTFLAHDNGSGRMASVTFTNCTFKTNVSGIVPSSALAFTFTSPVFTSAKRLISESSGDVTITVTGATGTIGEGLQTNASSGTMTINTSDMDITIDTSLASGSVFAWLWSKNSGYIVNWTGLRDKVKHTGSSGSRQVANLAKGSVKNNFCDYSGVSTIQIYWEIASGSSGGSYDHASNDNIFKSGVASGAWKVNASTYNTLAALQSGESPADSRSVAA